jgi:tRNA(Ile)-lysidine synthase
MPKPSAPPASPDQPVSASEFAASADACIADAPFAIAVSGGADSMALMCLAADWCRETGRPAPVVLTVDHGLREGSAAEAARVCAWAAELGLQHHTLKWQAATHGQPNLQAAARKARYTLMAQAMSAHGCNRLATGHTADDQAETFLIRLSRGSGLEGLSGMKARSPFPLRSAQGLSLARPLLAFPHRRLVATLRARGQDWIEDPSNANPRFLRSRIRAAAPILADLGLTPDRLAQTAAHLARASALIDELVDGLAEHAVKLYPAGYASLDPAPLRKAPDEILLRLLARVLKGISGADYAPRFDDLLDLSAWLRNPATRAGRTLGGCRLQMRHDGLLVARESAALRREQPVLRLARGQVGVWDGRFRVSIPASAVAGEYEVKTLGPEGVTALREKAVFPVHEPRRIAATCPAIWHQGRLASVPSLGFDDGIRASADFLGF